jgi:hypothetical protein
MEYINEEIYLVILSVENPFLQPDYYPWYGHQPRSTPHDSVQVHSSGGRYGHQHDRIQMPGWCILANPSIILDLCQYPDAWLNPVVYRCGAHLDNKYIDWSSAPFHARGLWNGSNLEDHPIHYDNFLSACHHALSHSYSYFSAN